MHGRTLALRAIQPTNRNLTIRFPTDMPYAAIDPRRIAEIVHNAAIARRANWSGINRADRRQAGQHGPGYQRLAAGGRHVMPPGIAIGREAKRLGQLEAAQRDYDAWLASQQEPPAA